MSIQIPRPAVASALLAGALLSGAGCGGGTSPGGMPPGGDPGYQVGRIGQILLSEFEGASEAWARIADSPSVPPEMQVARSGDCALYRHPAAGACDATCSGFCQAPSTCLPYERVASAGVITVTGLRGPLRLEPYEFGYSPTPADLSPDLFDAGVQITASASGDVTPAFTVSARGVAPLMADPATVDLQDDQDEVFRWVAGIAVPGTDGSRIQLKLQTGWHGAPYEMMLLCETADDGELTVSKDLIAQLPPFGGPSLFPWPSTMARYSRGVASTSAGPIELVVGSVLGVSWSHNLAAPLQN